MKLTRLWDFMNILTLKEVVLKMMFGDVDVEDFLRVFIVHYMLMRVVHDILKD